jgi:hypothetical protein
MFALTGKAADAVEMITSGITALRSTGATLWVPAFVSHLTQSMPNSANSTTLSAALAKR